MKKKALCLLLAMIMVLSILAGCTSKPAETPDTPATSEPAADNTANTPEEQPAEQPEEPALEQKTLQLMITGAGKQAHSDTVLAKMSLRSIAMRLTASCTTSPAGRACAASAAAGSS